MQDQATIVPIVTSLTKKASALHTVELATSARNCTTSRQCAEVLIVLAGLVLVAALEAVVEAALEAVVEANLTATEVEAAPNVAAAHLAATAAPIAVPIRV